MCAFLKKYANAHSPYFMQPMCEYNQARHGSPARSEIPSKPGGQAGSPPTGPGDSSLFIREKSPILSLYKTKAAIISY